MKVIQPNCREHLTGPDLDFIVSVLGSGEREAQFLTGLLTDPDVRDQILDNPLLVQAVLEHDGCLQISCHLYFYLLVRHGLLQAGLDDRELADYVAELLSEFSRSARMAKPLPDDEAFSPEYLVDMLIALARHETDNRFILRAHIGNCSLFMTGLFPDRISYREEHRGAPGLSYYETLGSASFGEASRFRLADEYHLASVFRRLSDRFHKVRTALNDVTARFLFVGTPCINVEMLLAK
ncbi:MAG: hypothetical protein JXR37_37110 [Kiritimatiellae bacterium]|nr:hypothetical protein [Kiritimatiellia bacterium]